MKKLLVLLIVLCLFGCEEKIDTKLSKLGYSDADIEIIKTYPENIQELFLYEYNYKYADLIKADGFDINKLDEYIEYYGKYDTKQLVKKVNDGMINPILDELYSNEYYIEKNNDLYIQYLDKYESVRDCIEAINTKTYLDYYTNIEQTDFSKDYLMLVNKYYTLGPDYEPDDLVDIDPYYGKGRTRAEVYEQYMNLADDAFNLGYSFRICSAYRSYDYQAGLYNKYLNEEGGNQAVVDTYSARPGHSEHQSGLCLDLADAVYGMDDFGKSEASTWINENCWKYGFIIRYTQEKVKITGYQAEPWQIRYVGSPQIAKDIMDRGITFDEYYACFVE